MRIVGVSGSGRTGGNTAVLVKAILDGARQGGAQTEVFELAGWNLHGCAACRACKKTQRCVQKDDMSRFYAVAPQTDVLVLASPIYLDHITAQMMAFIQRMYCYIGPELENLYPRKGVRAVVGITYGWDDPKVYQGVLDWMAERLEKYFDIPTPARFAIPGAGLEPVPEEHPEVQRARQFGLDLAQGRA